LAEALVAFVVRLAAAGFPGLGTAGLRTRFALGAGFLFGAVGGASAASPFSAAGFTSRFATVFLVVDVVIFPISSLLIWKTCPGTDRRAAVWRTHGIIVICAKT